MVSKPIASFFRLFAMPDEPEGDEGEAGMNASLAELQETFIPLLREDFVPPGERHPDPVRILPLIPT